MSRYQFQQGKQYHGRLMSVRSRPVENRRLHLLRLEFEIFQVLDGDKLVSTGKVACRDVVVGAGANVTRDEGVMALIGALRVSADKFVRFGQSKGEKVDLCIRLTLLMALYYRASHNFPEWSRGLLERESLAPTCISTRSGCVGVIHQFQRATHVIPCNPPVDWWLFLTPDGVDYQSYEAKPVHVLFGVVLSRTHWMNANEIPAMCLAASLFGNSRFDLRELACMDRAAAAQLLNLRIPAILQNEPWL